MKEYDPTKESYILGNEKGQFYIQGGRTYKVKKGMPPQLLLQIGVKRSSGGGQIIECRYCKKEFEKVVDLGKHYKATECGKKKYRDYIKRKFESRCKREGEQALKIILGE